MSVREPWFAALGERWRHVSGRTGLSWPLRLRWALLVPWRSRWNRWVRDWTARFEGHAREVMTLSEFVDEGAHRGRDGLTHRGSPLKCAVCRSKDAS